MNFGQALASLLNGRLITRAGWNRTGMVLGQGAPTGKLTQPYIYIQLANGECGVWCPDQADILATDWNTVGQGSGQEQGERQHAHAEI